MAMFECSRFGLHLGSTATNASVSSSEARARFCVSLEGVRQTFRVGGFEDLAAYSRAVRIGNHIAVSATAATGADGHALHEGDTYAQTKLAFERALEGLAALGATAVDILRTRMYLGPGADWRRAVDAHAELFTEVNPANSTYFVAGFIPDGVLVEVELDAILDS